MIKLCTINVSAMLDIRFKHIFSYTVLFYIANNLDTDKYIVKLTGSIFILKYNTPKASAENAIKELLDYKIITPYDKTKKLYRVNRQYIIGVREVDNLLRYKGDRYGTTGNDKQDNEDNALS